MVARGWHRDRLQVPELHVVHPLELSGGGVLVLDVAKRQEAIRPKACDQVRDLIGAARS